ncbi:hypothetical protein, variant 3 [Aphanomyces astaci]|uniref:Uncharacterized protein n=1 Tax=Aphanomyces astaci TaxID=112090 RepID=W4H0M3_APHAT|nr:hypothetical protein, variant 3 [Aphanomyces astaci]ETV84713.1 hypothetical protein, variant 3 [Aphanomyces astaci]|eukprot:XP_009826410.1 hypothetical protein, variant 3 [Aphanomyces astaci]
MSVVHRFAYATLVATDSYAVGAEVLRASLLATKSPYTLVILHTPTVSESVVENLRRLENVQVVPVAWLYPRPDQATSYAFDRFKDVWKKLRVFELTVYDTVAFLDSDMLVTQNMDELFTLIGDAPDTLVASLACTCNPMKIPHYPTHWQPENCPYWKREHGGMVDSNIVPKYFNSARPSNCSPKLVDMATFNRLVSRFQDEPDLSRFVFADQCFFNENFPNFHVASYKYNAVKMLQSAHPATWNMEVGRCQDYFSSGLAAGSEERAFHSHETMGRRSNRSRSRGSSLPRFVQNLVGHKGQQRPRRRLVDVIVVAPASRWKLLRTRASQSCHKSSCCHPPRTYRAAIQGM